MNCEICGLSFKIMSVYKKHLQTENHKMQRQTQDNFYTYIHYKAIHQKKWNKLNHQYIERCYFPRHKYNMRLIFLDINLNIR